MSCYDCALCLFFQISLLELTTGNGTVLPYLGWVDIECELKGDNKGSSTISLPMLVTDSILDHPIIGYNVLEQLISTCDKSSGTNEIVSALSSSLPNVKDENLNCLVESIRSGNDSYLCLVKVGKRNVIIPAGQSKKIICRVNAGFMDRGTPVIFESDVMDSLPNGIEIEESLLYLKGGNCVKVNVVASNTSLHDVVLKNRTVIGTLHLVRSVTPADVKWKELEQDLGQGNKSDQKANSESDVQSTTYQEELVPKRYFK